MIEERNRFKCPYCGSKKVREEIDRSNPIYYSSGVPIYGKKMVCTDCKNEWKV